MKTFGSSQKQESFHVADVTSEDEIQFWTLRPSTREATGQRLHMFNVKSGQQFFRQTDSQRYLACDETLLSLTDKKKKKPFLLFSEKLSVGASIQAAAVEF